jgi:hypothetical protein
MLNKVKRENVPMTSSEQYTSADVLVYISDAVLTTVIAPKSVLN